MPISLGYLRMPYCNHAPFQVPKSHPKLILLVMAMDRADTQRIRLVSYSSLGPTQSPWCMLNTQEVFNLYLWKEISIEMLRTSVCPSVQ